MADLITPNIAETINKPVEFAVNSSGGDFTSPDQSIITITPFDNYYAFTLFSSDRVALDLSDSSSYYLVFIDDSSEVRIKNKIGVEGIDPSKGDVLFKIDSISSRKILSSSGRVFFITSKIVSDDVSSEETVIFEGNWIRYDEEFNFNQLKKISDLEKTIRNLTSQLNNVQIENSTLVNSLRSKISTLQQENIDLRNRIEALLRIINKYDIKDDADSSVISDSGTEIVKPKPVIDKDKIRLSFLQNEIGSVLPFNSNNPGRPSGPNPGRPGTSTNP